MPRRFLDFGSFTARLQPIYRPRAVKGRPRGGENGFSSLKRLLLSGLGTRSPGAMSIDRIAMARSRILVVADDAALRASLARWLMAAGYGVELSESPSRARDVVANHDIALAIVAPNGLGVAGVELARELTQSV